MTSAHIGRDASLYGGRPYILETDVRVQDVFLLYEYIGVPIEDIPNQLGIPFVKVLAALTFAYEHLHYFVRTVESDQNNGNEDDQGDGLTHRGLSGH